MSRETTTILALLMFGLAGPFDVSTQETHTYRGIEVADENRCTPYDPDDYLYPEDYAYPPELEVQVQLC